jgi:hypothetical protein
MKRFAAQVLFLDPDEVPQTAAALPRSAAIFNEGRSDLKWTLVTLIRRAAILGSGR